MRAWQQPTPLLVDSAEEGKMAHEPLDRGSRYSYLVVLVAVTRVWWQTSTSYSPGGSSHLLCHLSSASSSRCRCSSS